MCYSAEMSATQIRKITKSIKAAGFECVKNEPLSPDSHGFLVKNNETELWVSVENDSEAVITKDYDVYSNISEYLGTL